MSSLFSSPVMQSQSTRDRAQHAIFKMPVLEEIERQDDIRFRVTIAVQNITKEANYRHAEACNLITFGKIGIVSMSE